MLLTRFLGYFARVAAPTTPAKIRFILYAKDGKPFSVCALKSVEFSTADATWTINLDPGLRIGPKHADIAGAEAILQKGEKPH